MKVSIITINLNNKQGLEKTLLSVFSQSYKDFELIVVDGNSADGSIEIINKFADQISFWVSEKDAGIYNAMNKGISFAKGEYLFFLNSGDVFLYNKSLEIVSKNLSGVDIVYFDIKIVRGATIFIKECPKELDFDFFVKDTIPHQSAFIKTSAFSIVGLYDESLKISSDWKWFFEGICCYNLSYKKIKYVFSVFFTDGISSLNTDILREERRAELKKMKSLYSNIDFPKKVEK